MVNDFGAVLGVIVTSSTVPRVPGEIGDSTSGPEGAVYQVARFQDFLGEMREGLLSSSLDGLIECRDTLVAKGAQCIATSCGLLWPYQTRLQTGCPVPFVSSALCLLDHLKTEFSGGLCVVTADLGFLPFWQRTFGRRLDGSVFCELGQDNYFYHALTGVVPNVDFSPETAQAAIIRSIASVLDRNNAIAAIVLECTNLSPYRGEIERVFGLPVYDIFSAIEFRLTRPDLYIG